MLYELRIQSLFNIFDANAISYELGRTLFTSRILVDYSRSSKKIILDSFVLLLLIVVSSFLYFSPAHFFPSSCVSPYLPFYHSHLSTPIHFTHYLPPSLTSSFRSSLPSFRHSLLFFSCAPTRSLLFSSVILSSRHHSLRYFMHHRMFTRAAHHMDLISQTSNDLHINTVSQ